LESESIGLFEKIGRQIATRPRPFGQSVVRGMHLVDGG
jgi:hypothetical protein